MLTPSRAPRAIARAEAVGSLLRPPEVAAQVERLYAGLTTAARSLVLESKPEGIRALNEAADDAVARLVQRQIDAGLDVVTDGEVRRASFLSSFYDAVDGVAPAPERFEVRDEDGTVTYSGFSDPVIASRLGKTSSPVAEEATYLRSLTRFPFKVTLPAPSYFLFPQFVTVDSAAYGTRQELLEHVVEIEKRLVADAIAAGARWIQFDFPVYPALVDAEGATYLSDALAESALGLFDRALAADAGVTAGIPPSVTVALHVCRGNFEGGFWNGSLAPLAERIFNELPHSRFLFEWEDVAREGGYEPIKHLPEGKTMVMGLISTKTPELEQEDEIVRRIDEASTYIDVDRLALCPQCGFASLFADHLVQAEDAQWRKLELVGKVADRAWGRG